MSIKIFYQLQINNYLGDNGYISCVEKPIDNSTILVKNSDAILQLTLPINYPIKNYHNPFFYEQYLSDPKLD